MDATVRDADGQGVSSDMSMPMTVRHRLVDPVAAPGIVLIAAPGGSGKTVLAEQIIAALDQRTIRVRLTEPADLAGFTGRLARAARRSGSSELALVLETAGAAAAGLDAFVGALAGDHGELTIVLDDVHHLERTARAAVVDALRDLPARCTLIVSGRDLDGFDDLAVSPRARRVTDTMLRMNTDEIAAVVGPVASMSVVDDIAIATTGWCSAVSLAAARLRHDSTWSPARSSDARSLLRELIDRVLAEDSKLAMLAHVPLVDEAVARIVGGEALCRSAFHSGLLQSHGGQWFVMPDPIRETIEQPAPLTEAEWTAIAAHYHACGESAVALDVLRSLPDHTSLLALLGRLRWTDVSDLGAHTVGAIVEDLSDAELASHQDVLLIVARAAEKVDGSMRTRLLDRASHMAARESAGPAARAVAAEQAIDLIAVGEIERAVATARSVLDLTLPDERLTRARALSAMANAETFLCTPESMAAGARLHRDAAEIFRHLGETRWSSECLARRGYASLYLAGHPHEGAAEMSSALALLPRGDSVRAFWLTYYADLLDLLDHEAEADAALAEALDIGVRRHDSSVIAVAWWTASWIAAHRHDIDGFRHAIAQVERHMDGWMRAGQIVEFRASTAEHFARFGDAEGYHRYITDARDIADTIGYDAPVVEAQARWQAMVGDPAAALEAFDRTETMAAVPPMARPSRSLLRAVAHYRLGDHDRARRLADSARAAARAMGVPNLLGRLERQASTVLEPLFPPGAQHAHTEWSLSLQVLGGFGATSDGRVCTPPSGHPATLVKFLAVMGPQTVDAALDLLWPDTDAQSGRARFRNLLNRLKDRSGPLVTRAGDIVQLHPRVSTDVAAFESQAARALMAGPLERIGLARHALALYSGPLLPGDVYEDWTAGPRERLKRRFLTLVDVVADDAMARDEFDEAARLIDIGIAAEPHDEGRYVRLCAVLEAQGRMNAAREAARRAAFTMAEVGGLTQPSLVQLAEG
jgi:DNA-binding SARP family transcriptional activator